MLDSPRVFAAILMILVLSVLFDMLARASSAAWYGRAGRRAAGIGSSARQLAARSAARPPREATSMASCARLSSLIAKET